MYGSTDVRFECEDEKTLIIMTLHIDDRTFPAVVKIDSMAAAGWLIRNTASGYYDFMSLFTDEARKLHASVNIQPYWNENFIRDVWFGRMMTDYHGFYNNASVTIGPHGWELTISPRRTSEFLDMVLSRCKESPHPTPPFNAAEILAFIEKGDNI